MTEIKNTTRFKIPQLPIDNIKKKIIGTKYNLSIAFVGEKLALSLNKKYRKKNYIPDILSFPLSKTEGEIVICPNIAKKKAVENELSTKNYIGLLLIHGMLHLKGHRHGGIMEKREKKYMQEFFNKAI